MISYSSLIALCLLALATSSMVSFPSAPPVSTEFISTRLVPFSSVTPIPTEFISTRLVPLTSVPSVSYTVFRSTHLFPPSTIETTTDAVCPACGFIASNPTSPCSEFYEYCGGTDVLTFTCVPGTCFNSDDCLCEDYVSECPSCGFSLDPAGDAGSFCYCISSPSVCGLECPAGSIFNENTCECGFPYVCQPCGFRKGSVDDCTEYYQCDYATGLDNGGPYFCPASFCFDDDICACVPF